MQFTENLIGPRAWSTKCRIFIEITQCAQPRRLTGSGRYGPMTTAKNDNGPAPP